MLGHLSACGQNGLKRRMGAWQLHGSVPAQPQHRAPASRERAAGNVFLGRSPLSLRGKSGGGSGAKELRESLRRAHAVAALAVGGRGARLAGHRNTGAQLPGSPLGRRPVDGEI